MRYATAIAFRTALERRLLTTAQDRGIPVVHLRKLVVFDRLLARLLVVAEGSWILKGAVALDFRLGPGARTTRDLDLARGDDEDAATNDLVAAEAIDLGDYFAFAIQRTSKLDLLLEAAAVRYHVRAFLAGRPFEDVTIDVGFGNSPADSEVLQGPDFLRFADIEPIQMPTIPLDQHVAEKLHAYARVYAGGESSSRVKDLVDLVLIQSFSSFNAERLQRRIETTFESRVGATLPTSLPRPPAGWADPYRRMASGLGIEPDVLAAHALVGAFIDPILGATLPGMAEWSPTRAEWEA